MAGATTTLGGGRFVDATVVGEGGQAVVLRAYDTTVERVVAIKRLREALAVDATDRKRFLREARMAAKLRHPNVIEVYEVIDDGEDILLVLEFVEGVTLRRRLETSLDPRQGLRFAAAVAAALAHAHERGVIHRDLKPDNVFVRPDDTVKVGDWGLARLAADTSGLTKTGLLLGTPRYMAPEQIDGAALHPSMDLYALGVMLYEIVAGRPPFVEDDLATLLKSHLSVEPPRLRRLAPSASPALDGLAAALLAKRPADRPASAAAVAAVLAELAATAPAAVAVQPTRCVATIADGDGVRPDAPRSRWRSVAPAVCLLLLLFIGTAALHRRTPLPPESTTTGTDERRAPKTATERFRRLLGDFMAEPTAHPPETLLAAATLADPFLVIGEAVDFAQSMHERYADAVTIVETDVTSDVNRLLAFTAMLGRCVPPNDCSPDRDAALVLWLEETSLAIRDLDHATMRHCQIRHDTPLSSDVLRLAQGTKQAMQFRTDLFAGMVQRLEAADPERVHPAVGHLLVAVGATTSDVTIVTKRMDALLPRLSKPPWAGTSTAASLICMGLLAEADARREQNDFDGLEGVVERALAALHDHVVPFDEGTDRDRCRRDAVEACVMAARTFARHEGTGVSPGQTLRLCRHMPDETGGSLPTCAYLCSELVRNAPRTDLLRREILFAFLQVAERRGFGDRLPRLTEFVCDGATLSGRLVDPDAGPGPGMVVVAVAPCLYVEFPTDGNGRFRHALPDLTDVPADDVLYVVSAFDRPTCRAVVPLYCASTVPSTASGADAPLDRAIETAMHDAAAAGTIGQFCEHLATRRSAETDPVRAAVLDYYHCRAALELKTPLPETVLSTIGSYLAAPSDGADRHRWRVLSVRAQARLGDGSDHATLYDFVVAEATRPDTTTEHAVELLALGAHVISGDDRDGTAVSRDDYLRADDLLQRAFARRPVARLRAELLLQRGRLLTKAGDSHVRSNVWGDALAVLHTVDETRLSAASAQSLHWNRGIALAHLLRLAESRVELERAAALAGPRDPDMIRQQMRAQDIGTIVVGKDETPTPLAAAIEPTVAVLARLPFGTGAVATACRENDRETVACGTTHDWGHAVDGATLFDLASVSKTVTAARVVSLAQTGRLQLDAPLSTLLPGVRLVDEGGRNVAASVTVTDFLRHRAGLPHQPGNLLDPTTFDGQWQRPDLLQKLTADWTLPLANAPGTYRYSNMGYALLGAVVERIEGRPLAECLDACCADLELPRHASRPTADDGNVAWGRIGDADDVRFNPPSWYGSTYALPFSGVWLSSESLADFGCRLLRAAADPKDPLHPMTVAPKDGDYGLGVVHGRRGDLATLEHDGSGPGFLCRLVVVPSRQVVVAVLCNGGGDRQPEGRRFGEMTNLMVDAVLATR